MIDWLEDLKSKARQVEKGHSDTQSQSQMGEMAVGMGIWVRLGE